MREPPVKKILYWCEHCNVPLIAKSCACGNEGKKIELLQPFDVRPALAWDMALVKNLIHERFGDVPLAKILLFNKTGGIDRADVVIMNGDRLGWLTFDPVTRKFSLDLAPEALPFLISHVKSGIVDLTDMPNPNGEKIRIGGKKFPLPSPVPDGQVIVKYRNRYGTGIVRDGQIRVKEIAAVVPRTVPDPGWDVAVERNRYHLKNLERSGIRTIKQHITDRPTANVSFSGGKDSTAVLHLARKAGVTKAFFIDTGIELPETIAFVESEGVEIIRRAGDFWSAAEKAGPPGKDNRWCCKLLKLHPLKLYLADVGPCVTVQGNRWYESWNRADLEETSQNPANPLQLNISPIRNWRALEVFLYLWWQKAAINPLYEKGLERIGCFLCPAMLESEYEELRVMHPDYAKKWDDFVVAWAEKKGYPDAYCSWGLWRWRALPPKMRELCREKGIAYNEDYTLQVIPVGNRKKSVGAKGGIMTEPVKKIEAEAVMNPVHQPETEPVSNVVTQTGAVPAFDVDCVRKDFPILGDIIYLDNAATSFSPEPVIEAMVEFEHNYRANVGRGVHRLTRIASQRYWHGHEKIAEFIGGKAGVTVFTKNTTESINMVAQGLPWKSGDRILTTILEHHSNLLPWMNLARKGVATDSVDIGEGYLLDPAKLEKAITPETRLVAITHASNVLGVITPVEKIARICRDHGVLLLVDAAQTVPHMPVDVTRIGCDFFAFSGHKMLGPTGTGVLWMKDDSLAPSMVGGGMVGTVTKSGFIPETGYQKYEAGTPNIAGGISLGVAAEYLGKLGMDAVRKHESELTTRLIDGLKKINRVRVLAPGHATDRVGVVSFTVDGIHPHEVAQHLDEEADIMVRSGHHCCQPLMEFLHLPEGTVRASIGMYNTRHEIDMLIATVEEIAR
jgi:cysteine desulfurase / selenocysteine lyase